MEFVDGESFEPLLDECDVLPRPEQIHARQRDAARILARLHSIGPNDVGLDDEPEVPLVEEVERWVRVFETVGDDLRAGYRQCADALHASLPAALPSTIVHGEYRLGNTLARGDAVVAVIDWELWSREDPRIDLSWFLSYVDAADQPSAIRPTPPGMPTRAELLAAYEAEAGGRVPDLAWFDAHARFKMASIASLINKHNRRRDHPDPAQEALVPVIGRLLEQARRMLG
jgi:aminoglycoside phosphotransferase (APT) family kinase protein